MKRLAALLLALILVLSACGPAVSEEKPEEPGKQEGEAQEGEEEQGEGEQKFEVVTKSAKDSLTLLSNFNVENLDYVVSDKNPDHEHTANFVDNLLENDPTGKLVPSLASEWSANDDKTVWTFKIKEGIKWVTNTGEEWPEEVTADDFVTGIRHGADFESGTSWLLNGVIKGYGEYLASDKTDAAWDKVGVKAVDAQTLEFTLESSTPYFDSMTTYSVMSPVNRTFLESKGTGCKLGAPDKENCEFGKVTPDSILYNGAYLLEELTAKAKISWVKNEAYWDADKVQLKNITWIFTNGKDQYESIRGFENGQYESAALLASWADYKDYLKKYEESAYISAPNSSTFGIVMNVNRYAYKDEPEAYKNTAHKDDASKENATLALQNENFRRALRASMDVVAWLGSNAPEEVAKAQVRNINNFPEAGTSKNGTYFQLVQKAYTEATGEEVNLEDGQYPWLSKEKAAEYIAAAEKEGVKFPVNLDLITIETRKDLVNKANSMADSIKKNSDGKIIVNVVLRSQDVVQQVAFQMNDPKQSDYDISTFSGWGPDFADPKTFAETYSAKHGPYLKNMGLGTGDENKDIKDKIGMSEYTRMIEEADKIVDDMDARYEAYAKADAYMIEKAFFIPNSQQTRSQVVSRYEPFTRPFANYGDSSLKFKGAVIREDIISRAEYEAKYADWQQAREENGQ
ncbi:MAG: ABC transporter substrate-binding protein [Tissierellia bacterium]|nr:ABC transporter substrate-binding protein [Tissierellia bacterium]